MLRGGTYTFVNNTIVNNVGPQALQFQSYRGGFIGRFLNNILWNPGSTVEIGTSSIVYTLTLAGSYNDLRNGSLAGTGNISSDPGFMVADTLYRLKDWSPCIGAGSASASVGGALLNAPSADFLGLARPRPVGSNPDIGALEHDRGNPSTDVEDIEVLATTYALSQNFPNPFNPSTTIRFSLPQEGNVRLTIFNLLGQKIEELVNEQLDPGMKQVAWDAKVPTGVYLYRLDVVGVNGEKYSETKRMTVLK